MLSSPLSPLVEDGTALSSSDAAFIAAMDTEWRLVKAKGPKTVWDKCDTPEQIRRKYDGAARIDDEARTREASRSAALLDRDAQRGHAAILSILAYGAVGNASAKHDDGPALLAAVEAATRLAACAAAAAKSSSSSDVRVVVLVPGPRSRQYLVRPLSLRGARGIELRVEGTLVIPTMSHFAAHFKAPPAEGSPELRRMQYACIEVTEARDFLVTGGGEIDGRGTAWWLARKEAPKTRAPVLLLIKDSTDVTVTHLRLQRSPFYHVVVLRSNRVRLARLLISSPWFSVNTDGVNVLGSRLVDVVGCWISTGDDNVAIKEGSSLIAVRGGTFQHGHGLSIGSLGENGTTSAPVDRVHVSKVTFVKTHHAARVKTWQGGRGRVSNVTFQDITCAAVAVPIVVDQFYCPQSQHPTRCQNSTAAVAIDDVRVDRVRGWHTSGIAAMLHCSDAVPCRVDLTHIYLHAAPGCHNYSRCLNVMPTTSARRPASRRALSTATKTTTTRPFAGSPWPISRKGNEMHGYRLDIPLTEKPRYCFLSAHYGHKKFCQHAASHVG